jgi:hypothetical protein
VSTAPQAITFTLDAAASGGRERDLSGVRYGGGSGNLVTLRHCAFLGRGLRHSEARWSLSMEAGAVECGLDRSGGRLHAVGLVASGSVTVASAGPRMSASERTLRTDTRGCAPAVESVVESTCRFISANRALCALVPGHRCSQAT